MQLAVLLFHNVMAHFAEIEQKTDPTGFTTNTQWIVKRVVVVDNGISTSNGPLVDNDMHVDGETWCKTWFKGGEWKQTSYNSKFRNIYAGIGYVYDFEKDVFIQTQPFASWTLNANNRWEPPVAMPPDFVSTVNSQTNNQPYSLHPSWDEENQRWYVEDVEVDNTTTITRIWNPETSSWEN